MSGSALRSPVSGRILVEDTPHSLSDGAGERWPVVDAIPYLRTGRAASAAQALACLDDGDRAGALGILLGDQDDWWNGASPEPDRLADLVANRDRLSLRQAMEHLALGRVGDYFAHHWSDPTFLAGLALLEAHWRPAASAFELACGIGHYGREFMRRGQAYTGGDVVFAKLWLARWWVLGPAARLICFDAAAPWPLADERFDIVLCQDAFYFLEPKPIILDRLRRVAAPEGWIAVGHVHNREAPNWSSGAAIGAADLAALFPGAVFYDDNELTEALVEARAPKPQAPERLRSAEAFAVADGPGLDRRPRSLTGGFAVPPEGAKLRPNPLYAGSQDTMTVVADTGPRSAGPNPRPGRIRWPSLRYQEEYSRSATYPEVFREPASAQDRARAVRNRALVDLPERW